MEDNKFVLETSNWEKLKSFFVVLGISCFFVVLGVLLAKYWNQGLSNIGFLNVIVSAINNSISNFTIWGVFYASFLGGLFFVPTPDEVLFYYAITKNSLILFSILATLAGYFLAQLINYYIGLKASDHILNFVSKRQLYKSRRYINKYGGIGIFLFHLLPFPAPVLVLGLGLAKYNLKRLFIWAFLGKILKLIAIAGFYLFFRLI